jgi:hypothetical protein
VILVRELDEKWWFELDALKMPLHRGLPLIVDAKMIRSDDPDMKLPSGEVKFRLVDWQYRIKDAEDARLELFVEAVYPPVSDVLFKTDNSKFYTAVLVAIATGVWLGAIWYNTYLDHDYSWAMAGRHARTYGWVALAALFFFILPSRLKPKRRLAFRNLYAIALLTLTGIALIAAWLSITRLPAGFGGSDQEYAGYARALAGKLSMSYWPVLLAVLPWLGVAFKVFGFDAAEKTTDAVMSAAKKEGG